MVFLTFDLNSPPYQCGTSRVFTSGKGAQRAGWFFDFRLIDLLYAFACCYISNEQHSSLLYKAEEAGKMLGKIISKPERRCNK